MNKHPEYNDQIAVAYYLDTHPKKPLWCASAGGMRTNIGTAVKMKKMGYKKGFPDIQVLEESWDRKYSVLFIELKTKNGEPFIDTKKGVLSKEQKEWLDRLNDNGYKACVAYGADEAIKIINDYLL